MTLTQRILESVRANPGRSSSELATTHGCTIRRASDTIGKLAHRGLVRSERVRVTNGTQNRVWPVGESEFEEE